MQEQDTKLYIIPILWCYDLLENKVKKKLNMHLPSLYICTRQVVE